MKILGIGPQAPWPPVHGGQEGIYGAIAAIAKYVEFLYTCPGDPATPQAEEHYASIGVTFKPVVYSLTESLRFIIRSSVALKPFKFHKYGTPDLARLVDAALGDFEPDAIICFHSHMHELAVRLKRMRGWRAPIIVREHNIEYEMLESYAATLMRSHHKMLLRIYAWVTKRYELRIWQKADAVALLTDRDYQTATSSGVGGRFVLAPEGIPIPPVRTLAAPSSDVLELLIPLNPRAAQSAANASRFLREYWLPLSSRKELGRFRVTVTGANPSQLAEVSSIELERQRTARIDALGFLPSLRPAFERAFALICPTFYGAGIRKKMLEGMANQVPVIATEMDIRTCTYLQDGENILSLGSVDDFANTLVALKADPLRWELVAANGRRTVEMHAQWDGFARIIVDEIRSLLESRQQRP